MQAETKGKVITHVVQAVRELYEVGEGFLLPAAVAKPESRLVFIGKQLEKESMQAAFSRCVSDSCNHD